MLKIFGERSSLCDGISRREMLRIGGIGLVGLSLPGLLRAREENILQPKARAKSIILLFNSGGIPHHETWDPKPEAPQEIRGPFGAIQSKTPGLMVGELMPKTAMLTEKIAVIRSMVTMDNSHSTSGYQMLTGVPHIPLSKENAGPGKPNDWPSFNAIVKALRSSATGLPSSVMLPRKLANFDGLYPWPGTDAGFLGHRHDPWLLVCDPAEPNFTAPGCELPKDLSPLRIDQRRSLLSQVEKHLDGITQDGNLDHYRRQALDLISGQKARESFDLNREPQSIRDRYGRTKYGQSVLLARRLVEAGVSLVQVNWISEDKKLPNGGGWDTHEKHNESLKGWLMPSMDQTYSALIEDLSQRGLLDETLVCWVAEFGHTPRFNAKAGRDHWGKVFSIALAGGGIRGGVVVGKTDRNAAEPTTDAVLPADYLATLFHCLGFSADTIIHDMEKRPLPISRGRVIKSILA
jgi:hypothetical protein